ncbi:hypothetical protein [Limosilactobacillus antri]|uniref:hypothetical protein n=1 Tax=Limosilactobacillus antri TaxID=227943 RepID=UPI001F57DEA8|nr:hypothetical protein [Limosilactobacillus antri]
MSDTDRFGKADEISEGNIFCPQEVIRYDDIRIRSFTPDEILKPLSVTCHAFTQKPVDKEGLCTILRSLLGLEAVKIQAEQEGYKPKEINWEMISRKGDFNNFFLKVENDGGRVRSWQVKTTQYFSQFLLLDKKYYSDDGTYRDSITDPVTYYRYFLQRIQLNDDLPADELLKIVAEQLDYEECVKRCAEYAKEIKASFGEARYITKEDFTYLRQNNFLLDNGSRIKVYKDSDNKGRSLEGDHYYALYSDMRTLTNQN